MKKVEWTSAYNVYRLSLIDGLIELVIEWKEADENYDAPGYLASVVGIKNRELPIHFRNIDEAKLAIEKVAMRLLEESVNQIYFMRKER